MHTKRPRVLITHWVHEEVLERLMPTCDLVLNTSRETWSHERVRALARNCEAMMAFMPDRVDEAFLADCPKLSVIAAALKGIDNFDVDACTRRGVWLTCVRFSPDVGSAVNDVRRAIALEAAENILDALAGKVPRAAINAPAKPLRAPA